MSTDRASAVASRLTADGRTLTRLELNVRHPCPSARSPPDVHRHRLGLQHRGRQVPGLRPRRQGRRRGPPADRPVDRGRRLRAEPDAARRAGAGHARGRSPPGCATWAGSKDWVAGGISATHHTAGRIDAPATRSAGPSAGTTRRSPSTTPRGWSGSAGQERVQRADRRAVGRPLLASATSSRTSDTLSEADWERHGLHRCRTGRCAAGYLTGRFDVTSVSSAASTGIMDLRTNQWRREMLDALGDAGVPRPGLEAAAADRRT